MSPGGLALRILSVKNEENGDRPTTRTGLRSPTEVKSSTRVVMRHASRMPTHCRRKPWRARQDVISPKPVVDASRRARTATVTHREISAPRAWTARCRQDIILASRAFMDPQSTLASRRLHGDFARRSLYTFPFSTLGSARRSVRPVAGARPRRPIWHQRTLMTTAHSTAAARPVVR